MCTPWRTAWLSRCLADLRGPAIVGSSVCSKHTDLSRRDDLTREGRGKELDEPIKTTRVLQDSLPEGVETAAATDDSGTGRS